MSACLFRELFNQICSDEARMANKEMDKSKKGGIDKRRSGTA